MLNTNSDTDLSTTLSTGISTTGTHDRKTAQAIAKRARQEIKHHILENAVEYTMDVFWKDRLMDAARGKFPKGFYYQDGCIVHSKNNKERRVLLPTNPLDTAKAFIQFLQFSGIYSDRDIEFAKLDAAMRNDSFVQRPITWTKISKKMKISMIRSYAQSMARLWNLTTESARDFQTVLEIGFRNDAINKNNIEFNGIKITLIRDVYMDETTGKFFIDPSVLGPAIYSREREQAKHGMIKVDLSKYPNPALEPTGVDFSAEWKKYVDVYRHTFPHMFELMLEEKKKMDAAEIIEVEF